LQRIGTPSLLLHLDSSAVISGGAGKDDQVAAWDLVGALHTWRIGPTALTIAEPAEFARFSREPNRHLDDRFHETAQLLS
jgi:hypothetical protein